MSTEQFLVILSTIYVARFVPEWFALGVAFLLAMYVIVMGVWP